ncbi:MAG: carbamoyltransferase HypF, partial [Candidatus Latescibacteria bacterium]|nr:carbamoyltransferase HypF [Candidatus Latescibacterota bacterium]
MEVVSRGTERGRVHHGIKILRWRIQIEGVVQGVGFRPFVSRLANLLHLGGWIQNVTSGVRVEIQGQKEDLAKFVAAVKHKAPTLARVLNMQVHETLPSVSKHSKRFDILPSESVSGRTLVSPDVAVCPD